MSIFKRLAVCDDLALLLEKYEKVEGLTNGQEYPAGYYKGINEHMRKELKKLITKHSGGIYPDTFKPKP
jgi:hypothetical protein